MATKNPKPVQPDQRARTLRQYLDWGHKISPQDAAWLKAYEAAEAKRMKTKATHGTKVMEKAEKTAKKEGRTPTLADLREASRPATPSTKGRLAKPGRVVDHAGVLAVAIQNHEVETLAMAKALAFGSLPRSQPKESVRKVARMGTSLWVAVDYAAKRKKNGGGIMHGTDSLALIAMSEMAHQGVRRVEFESMSELLNALAGSQGVKMGGKQKELAFEMLRRVFNTSVTATFYSSEEEARTGKNELRAVEFSFITDYWNPFHESLKGQESLFKPYLDLSPSFLEHAKEKGSMAFLPTNMVHAFVGHPLKLQFAMWLYPRVMGAKTITCVPMGDLVEQFGEGREARWLIRDLQLALDEIHAFYQAAKRKLHARFVQGIETKTGGRGRPSKTWHLEIGPSDKLTGTLENRRTQRTKYLN